MEQLLLLCRALSSPTLCRFIPALSVRPLNIRQEIDYIEERRQQLHAYEFKWNTKKGAVRFPKTFLRNYEDVLTKTITPANYDE